MRCRWAIPAIASGLCRIQRLTPGKRTQKREALRESLLEFGLKGIVVCRSHALDLVVVGREREVLLTPVDHRLCHGQTVEDRQRFILVSEVRKMRGSRC